MFKSMKEMIQAHPYSPHSIAALLPIDETELVTRWTALSTRVGVITARGFYESMADRIRRDREIQ